jgi:peptidoglycan hydrolase CwlO-like protein
MLQFGTTPAKAGTAPVAQSRLVDYGPPFVLGRRRSRTARFAGLAAVLTLMAASAALAAPGTADSPRSGAAMQTLDSKTHQALLGLYALDSQLQAWKTRLGALGSAAAALRQRRLSLRQELGAVQSSLQVGQRQLAVDLRALYEQGNVDPVAIMLGAASLDKGLSKLDHLSRIADESRRIVAVTSSARRRLQSSKARLAVEGRKLARSLAAARQAEQRLESAAAARLSYVSSLRAQERLQAAQVRTVEAAAQAAQQKS